MTSYPALVQLVGHRVWVEGHGIGLVLGFSTALIGASSHVLQLEASGVQARRQPPSSSCLPLAPPQPPSS